jgi:hypothetical protein
MGFTSASMGDRAMERSAEQKAEVGRSHRAETGLPGRREKVALSEYKVGHHEEREEW